MLELRIILPYRTVHIVSFTIGSQVYDAIKDTNVDVIDSEFLQHIAEGVLKTHAEDGFHQVVAPLICTMCILS